MDVLPVILAGGEGTRLGPLGKILPKSLLPVSSTATLLTRNLDLLAEAGLTRVIISTSLDMEELIAPTVRRYMGTKHERSRLVVEVMPNEGHTGGPLTALAQMLRRFTARRYLMVLGDVFFRGSPFGPLCGVCGDRDDDHVLLVNRRPEAQDIAQGGVVRIRGTRCDRLFLKATDCAKMPGCELGTWPGVAVFGESARRNLADFVAAGESNVEEDFVNDCIEKGIAFTAAPSCAFVNVNTFGDYLRVLDAARSDATWQHGTGPGSG